MISLEKNYEFQVNDSIVLSFVDGHIQYVPLGVYVSVIDEQVVLAVIDYQLQSIPSPRLKLEDTILT